MGDGCNRPVCTVVGAGTRPGFSGFMVLNGEGQGQYQIELSLAMWESETAGAQVWMAGGVRGVSAGQQVGT